MENLDLVAILGKAGLFFPPFLLALSFHEFAHGWVANKKGDNTAEVMGRLTMNPFAHADVTGTFILPLAAIVFGMPLFGWAKPVPVNPRNLKNIKNDMFWIALAGPLSNILLAIVGLVLFYFTTHNLQSGPTTSAIIQMVQFFIAINIILAVFNMLPFHPLDGGKVIARFLPPNWNRALEEYQGQLNIVLICIFIFGGFHYLAAPIFSVLQRVLVYVAAI